MPREYERSIASLPSLRESPSYARSPLRLGTPRDRGAALPADAIELRLWPSIFGQVREGYWTDETEAPIELYGDLGVSRLPHGTTIDDTYFRLEEDFARWDGETDFFVGALRMPSAPYGLDGQLGRQIIAESPLDLWRRADAADHALGHPQLRRASRACRACTANEFLANFETGYYKPQDGGDRLVTDPNKREDPAFYSSLARLARELDRLEIDGLVLFNRFYQPDFDVEALEVVPRLHLSESFELLPRLRWLAVLSGRVRSSLAVTGGVHTPLDAVKAVMAGAHAVQMVAGLLREGPELLREVREGLETWLIEHEYDSLRQMQGSMSLERCPDPAAFERVNYTRVLQSWRP